MTSASAMNIGPNRWRWVISIGAVTYIALIGIFAIEEIKARNDAQGLLVGRIADFASELALTPDGSARHTELEQRRDALVGLRTRLSILSIDGAVPLQTGRPGTLKEILCELAAVDDSHVVCPVADNGWTASDIAPHLLLKYLSEHSGTGEVLAVLIITAAFGGALIQTSLEAQDTSASRALLRTLLRAIGGGIVCYLIVVGGNLPATELKNASSPATASLLGLLSGMFSNRVFELLSELIDAFVDKVRPKRMAPDAPLGPEGKGKTVVAIKSVEP